MTTAVFANHTGRNTFAFKLARALGIEVINANDRLDIPVTIGLRLSYRLINWGTSARVRLPEGYPLEWVANRPGDVHIMSNKLHMFRAFEDFGVPCLEWTNDRQVAQGWLESGVGVYERHKLTGHSGQGIVFKGGQGNGGDPERIADAPLYTKDLAVSSASIGYIS